MAEPARFVMTVPTLVHNNQKTEKSAQYILKDTKYTSMLCLIILQIRQISSLFLYKKDMNLLRTFHWELTLNTCSVKFIILFAKLFEIYRVSRTAVSVRNFGKSLLI